MRTYRVRVAGKIFENENPRVLLRRAVEAKKSRAVLPLCRNCGSGIEDAEMQSFNYCLNCIEQAIALLQLRKRMAG